ncbi:hypothetical protein ACH5RR_039517 [Cinchona calisaya]|uniref:Uncharacterized protein n=1 Tax=Cinchona calisaya TaxID=153742 RepID=A0ABD2Y1Y9_9GENT
MSMKRLNDISESVVKVLSTLVSFTIVEKREVPKVLATSVLLLGVAEKQLNGFVAGLSHIEPSSKGHNNAAKGKAAMMEELASDQMRNKDMSTDEIETFSVGKDGKPQRKQLKEDVHEIYQDVVRWSADSAKSLTLKEVAFHLMRLFKANIVDWLMFTKDWMTDITNVMAGTEAT